MTPDEIYQRRKALGLSQAKLAKALGVTVGAVSRWERGGMTPAPYLGLALVALEERAHRALFKGVKVAEIEGVVSDD